MFYTWSILPIAASRADAPPTGYIEDIQQSESAKEHQKQATIIGVICFAHKKCKTGALGAARS